MADHEAVKMHLWYVKPEGLLVGDEIYGWYANKVVERVFLEVSGGEGETSMSLVSSSSARWCLAVCKSPNLLVYPFQTPDALVLADP